MAETAPRSSSWPWRVCHERWPANLARSLLIFFATGAYAGFVPVAPGTAGSVVGLIVARFLLAPVWSRSPAGFVVLFGVLFWAGCGLASAAENVLGESDSSSIVIDEILGMTAALFLNPLGWPWLIAGFLLFRLFDIIKPWPAARFDSMRGGTGVMLDDLAAGVYANIVLQILWRVLR